MGFKENVLTMKNAGVPDTEIDAYVQKHGKDYQPETPGFIDNVVSGLKDRGTWEGAGALIGGLGGGVAGLPVGGPFGSAGGAAAGSGLGAAAGGQLNDLVFGNEGSLLDQSKKALTDTAVETGMSMVAPKALQTVGQGAKNLFSPVKKFAANRGNLVGNVGPEDVANMKTLEGIGGRPDASLIDNPNAQKFGQSLRAKPGSAQIMADVDNQNYAATQGLVEDVAQKFGSSETADQAGKTLKQQAAKKKGQFFDIAEQLYDRAYINLPEQFEVPRLRGFVDSELARINQNPVSIQQGGQAIPILNAISETIGEGITNKETINSFKQLAKDAFNKAPKDRTPADKILIDMRNVYADDISDAVKLTGGPEDLQRLTVANEWWKKGMGDKRGGVPGYLDRWDKIIGKEEGADAYSYATQNIYKKNGGADRLKDVFRSNPGAKGEIQAQVFRDMGTNPTTGEFSYQKFLTNSAKMAPEAKELLFGRAGKGFEKLTKISEMAAALEKSKNFSNTENLRVYNSLFEPIKTGINEPNNFIGAAVGGAKGAATVAADLLFQKKMAKLYTDPDFVKWLADSSRAVLSNPNDIKNAVARLGLISSKWPNEQSEAALEYINQIGFDTKTRKDKDGKIKKVQVN